MNATHAARARFHREHLAILESLERQDPEQAAERMQAHLEGVRESLLHGGTQDSQNHPDH